MNPGKIKTITVIVFISLLPFLYCVLPIYKEVTIQDGSRLSAVKTCADTVGGLLLEKGIELMEQDKVEPGLDTVLSSKMTVKITRARAVKLVADGEINMINTTGACVSEVLKEAGIVLGEHDRAVPDLEEPYTDTIQVVRVDRKKVPEQKSLAYDIQKVTDNDLFKGEQRIRQKGKNGLEKLLYEVVVEDGKEVARKLVERVVARKPVNEIVAVGTKQTVSRGGKLIDFKEFKSMTATGYTHTGNRTYTDIWPSVGTVAVDPQVIPLGTRLYIEGYGHATAMDIGSAIKGGRIDLFFETRKEAMRWGRRTVQVYILE